MLRERPGDIREAFRAGLNQALPAALRSGDPGVRQAALALLAGLVQHPGVVAVLQKVCSRVLCQVLGFRAMVRGVVSPPPAPVCGHGFRSPVDLGAQCGNAFSRHVYRRAMTSMRF